MNHKAEGGGLRPSVLLTGLAVLLGCGLAIFGALSFDPLADAGAAETDDPRPRRGSASDRDRAVRPGGRRPPRTSTRHLTSGAGGQYNHHDWGRETTLSHALALHLPGPNFWSEAAENGPPANDPQMQAMWRSYRFAAGEDSVPALPFEPTAHRAELIEATGDVASSPTNCDVRVLPVTSGSFNCVVRVMCDGRVLYPNDRQTAGYVPCEIVDGRPVRAVDSGSTGSDGDPLVDLDLERGTVRVEEFDDSGERTYSATLRIQS